MARERTEVWVFCSSQNLLSPNCLMCPVRSYILDEKACPAAVWINRRWLGFLFPVLSSGISGDTASSSGFLPQITHCNRDQDYDGALTLSCSSVAHNGCILSLFPGDFSLGLGWKGVWIRNRDALWPFKLKSVMCLPVMTWGCLGLLKQLFAMVLCRVSHGAFPAGACEHYSNHAEHARSYHHALIEIGVHSPIATWAVSDLCTYRAWLWFLWNGPVG